MWLSRTQWVRWTYSVWVRVSWSWHRPVSSAEAGTWLAPVPRLFTWVMPLNLELVALGGRFGHLRCLKGPGSANRPGPSASRNTLCERPQFFDVVLCFLLVLVLLGEYLS